MWWMAGNGIGPAVVILAAFVLDLCLGDPSGFPHPVILMGRGISFLEKHLRRLSQKRPRQDVAAGAVMAVIMVAAVFGISFAACLAAAWIHPLLGLALQIFWCWQALAARGLKTESMRVYRCFVPSENLEKAQKAVARIVGRDTDVLDKKGVIRAAVETVAENFSDGVFAPLFYMAIGGAPLALAYKAVNTMDSMCGYKNDRYLYYGRAAARLDDAANWIPSRLAALFWIAAACLIPSDSGKNAMRIWKRDRRMHASPNSAQTESACAGALGVQLAGPAMYFGEYYDKPYIGDPLREIVPEDILRTDRMMILASVLAVIVLCALCFLAGRMLQIV